MKLKNPTDEVVHLPTLGLSVDGGGSVEVTGAAAESLIEQGWVRVDRPRNKTSRRRPEAKGAGASASATTTSGAPAPADGGD